MRGGAKVTIEPHRHEGNCVILYHMSDMLVVTLFYR